jgi:hypothetical protein
MGELEMSKMQIYKELSTQKVSTTWIFPLYFQLRYLPEETCFQQGGSSAVERTSQGVLGSSHQRKVPASLFLKSEKIPGLLCRGKGPVLRPFSYT